MSRARTRASAAGSRAVKPSPESAPLEKDRKAKGKHGHGTTTQLPSGRVRWQVLVTLPNGEKERRGGTVDSEKEARQSIARALVQAEEGDLPPSHKLTLSRWLEHWQKVHAPSIAPRTRELYAHYVRKHILPSLGELKLTAVSEVKVRAFYADLYETAKLANSTRRHIHNVLHMALKQAKQDRLVRTNVTDEVKPTYEREEKRSRKLKAFTPEEAALFYPLARADRSGLVLAFMLCTGLRRGEALGLQWERVNLETGRCDIEEGLSILDNKPQAGTLKTERSRRVITVAGDALGILRERKGEEAIEEVALRGYTPSGYVFTSLVGTPLNPQNVGRIMARLCKAAGIPDLNPHGLRHTYTSLLAAQGIAPEVLSKQLGHARASFTMDFYRTVFDSERNSMTLEFTPKVP